MNGTDKISCNDIMFVIGRLWAFYSGYNVIVEKYIERNEFPFMIYAAEMGIDTKKLFQRDTIVEFSLPESFQLNEMRIDLGIYIASARFGYIPPLSRFIQYEGIDIDDSQQYGGLGIGPSDECYFENQRTIYASEDDAYDCTDISNSQMLNNNQELPKGARIASVIFIHSANAAVLWMGLLAEIMNYYIAAIEPLVTERAVSPALSEMDNIFDIGDESMKKENLKTYRKRCFSFKLFLDEVKRDAIRRKHRVNKATNRIEKNHDKKWSKILTKKAVCEYLGWVNNTLTAHINSNPDSVMHIGRQQFRFDTDFPAFSSLPVD